MATTCYLQGTHLLAYVVAQDYEQIHPLLLGVLGLGALRLEALGPQAASLVSV